MIDNKKIEDVAKQHSQESYISGYFKLPINKDLLIVLNGCKKSF